MKKILLFCLFSGCLVHAQSAIQAVNSGSVLGAVSSASVGEIVVVPQNPSQSQSGLIGILAQNQALSVPELVLSGSITAYPNPTVAGLYFHSAAPLTGKTVSVYNASGQKVLEKKIDPDNRLDLALLAAGIYLVQFNEDQNKSFKIVKY